MSDAPGRPLRVVTLVDSLGSGGAERIVLELAIAHDPERVRSIVCITRDYDRVDAAWEEAEKRLRAAGVQVVQLRRRSRVAIWAWRPLYRLLRAPDVGVLHAHMFGSSLWGTLIGRLARVPVVVAHDHGWAGPRPRAHMLLSREVISRGCDAIIAVSRHTRRQIIEQEGIADAKVVFIPNGIPRSIAATGASVRDELGIAAGDPVVGSVGMLRPEKALEVLVEAVAMLVRGALPNLRLLLAGEGDERARLERLVLELGIGENVRLLGLRTDVADVIAGLDVAASSSDFEGSPVAIMEYMAGARPIVATRVGGVPDLIEDGVHGRLVPPRSPEALAGAIGELLSDPAAAAEMGRRARDRRESEFTVDVMAARLDALYRELRRRSRRRPAPSC